MKHYKDYFKSRKEVEQYFKNETFKFSFMSDDMIHFETLNPVFLNDGLFSFELSFYYENGVDFFCYTNFKDTFCKLQLCEVVIKSEETTLFETMYFEKYVDPNEN